VFLRTLATLVLLLAAADVAAQPAVECPTSECPQAAQTLSPAHVQMWRDAAAIHQIKIAFVDALQRFVRAQAGTFGDEADDLRQSLAAMRTALSEWTLAIQQFQSKSSRIGRDAETDIAMATVWLDRHRVDAALRALDGAEQRDAGRVDLHTLRALAYGAADRWDEAARALRRAVVIDPRNPTLSYALAQRLAQLRRPDDAAQALRSVQRALDDRRTSATSPGANRPAPFERVDLLRQVSGVAPIFPGARYAAGFAALETGDYETALARFDDAVSGDPMLASSADTRARVVAAASALERGQLDAARQHLQLASEGSPNDSEPHRLLGLIYWVDEQTGKSIEHLRRAIQLAPADERARVLLSDVLADDRRLAEAERELIQARDAGLHSGQIAYRLARLYERQSLLPQAAMAFQDSESFGPVVGQDRFYQEWGSLLVNRADFDGAVVVYAKRVDVNTNSAEAHRQLGEIYFLEGRNDEALAEFSVAVWLDPKDARAHAAAGQVYARLPKYPDAIAAFQRALSLDSSLREARYALGTALMRAGKADEARRELERFGLQQAEAEAAGQREFQRDALRRQASKDTLGGNREGALAGFEAAARMDPQSARSQRDLGLALLRAQRPREAIEHLVAAQRIEETAEGFVYLVDAYGALGNAEEANRQRTLAREFAMGKRMERVRELDGR
jgi:tetratricopeptide (TPR) repeat protein